MLTAKDYAMLWVTQNQCDGDDRSKSGNADTYTFNSPDLYELVSDALQDYHMYLIQTSKENKHD